MKTTLLAILTLPFAAGSALSLDPHVEAVIRIVESAHGKVERTEDGQSLKLIDLAVPNAGPHDKRTSDPYDAAFFEHVGHITTLESLNIISTKFNDEWMPSIAGLTNLKTLRFTNNGKLSDAGLEKLAALKNMEAFSYVGTSMTARAFAKFEGWTRLTKCSFRGSSIDDEGLKQISNRFPNLESISLAHAKFTDAGAPSLAKLTKLKGIELGTSKATPQTLTHLAKLPLEYLQLGEGFDSPECIPLIRGLSTLRRLTLTNAKALTDADLKMVAGMTQLEQLELGKIDLPDERLAVLKDFAFLKSLRLVPAAAPFTPETQVKIKQLLPKAELKFQ